MTGIKNYEWKFFWLEIRQGLRCKYTGRNVVYDNDFDLHHKLRNHDGNRINYPLLIHSIINLELIWHPYHIDYHGNCGTMSDERARVIEKYLEKYPIIAQYVNGEIKKINQNEENEIIKLLGKDGILEKL